MRDAFLALLALCAFAGFVGILVWSVPELDLATVIGIVVLMAAIDFIREIRRARR